MRKSSTRLIAAGLMLSGSCSVMSVPFGSFDARTLAMGGTAVASAKNPLGCFYNPALLATYSHYKENPHRSSRISFPVLSGRYHTVIEETIDIADQDLDGQVRSAINAYNANQNVTNAQAVVDASQNLLNALSGIANQSMLADANAGLAVSIPSKRQGGAFCMNVRAVGGGAVTVPQADLDLANRYVQALTFVATGGAEGVNDPDLFDGDGDILDLTDNFTSSAVGRGLIILQTAIAMSKEFTLYRKKVALGLTPKFQRFSTFDETVQVNEDRVSASKDPDDIWLINVDIGAYMELDDHWRTGLVIKNLIPKSLNTDLNNNIKIEPQVRAALAYQASRWLAAIDLDLLANAPLGTEAETRFINLGYEWQAYGALKLRAGYSTNLADHDKTGLFTAGVGYQSQRFDFAIAYGESSGEKAAGLQLAYLF